MKLKVCGLKYEDNVKELSSLAIDYMGFIFYKKSPRYIDAQLSFDFIRTLPSHIKKVGVFVNESCYSVLNTVAHYNLDYVQLHGDESEKVCAELKPFVKVIKAFRVNDDFDFKNLEKYVPHVDAFLFDTDTKNYGGSGLQFNWDILKNYQINTPFFLSGGIDETSIEKLKVVNHPQLHTIDINSKFEIEPGLKNSEKIKQFIVKIKDNDNTKKQLPR